MEEDAQNKTSGGSRRKSQANGPENPPPLPVDGITLYERSQVRDRIGAKLRGRVTKLTAQPDCE